MAIEDDLFAGITAALTAGLTTNLTTSNAAWDLFEAFILTIVVDAAQRQGATISFEDVHGATPTIFYFRTGPGNIYSTAHEYCHAIVDFQDPAIPLLEVHLGIYVTGRSHINHECDVAVILRSEGQTCRANSVHPQHNAVIMSCECKFYTSGLGVKFAREFLGLVTEIASKARFFVTNSTSASVEKVLSHHDKRWANEIEPAHGDEIVDLRGLFVEVFRTFKAKHLSSACSY